MEATRDAPLDVPETQRCKGPKGGGHAASVVIKVGLALPPTFFCGFGHDMRIGAQRLFIVSCFVWSESFQFRRAGLLFDFGAELGFLLFYFRAGVIPNFAQCKWPGPAPCPSEAVVAVLVPVSVTPFTHRLPEYAG